MSHFGPANDNTPPPSAERRSAPRRRALLKGKIVYPHNSLSADCTVRDLSSGGARIRVDPGAVTADPFLIVVSQAVVHEAQTAWRVGDQAGLRFVRSTDLSGETPLRLRAVQRLWLELMPRSSG